MAALYPRACGTLNCSSISYDFFHIWLSTSFFNFYFEQLFFFFLSSRNARPWVDKASYKSVAKRLDMSWQPHWRGNLISLHSFQSETPQGSDCWIQTCTEIHSDIQCCALLFCSAWTILFKMKMLLFIDLNDCNGMCWCLTPSLFFFSSFFCARLCIEHCDF